MTKGGCAGWIAGGAFRQKNMLPGLGISATAMLLRSLMNLGFVLLLSRRKSHHARCQPGRRLKPHLEFLRKASKASAARVQSGWSMLSQDQRFFGCAAFVFYFVITAATCKSRWHWCLWAKSPSRCPWYGWGWLVPPPLPS